MKTLIKKILRESAEDRFINFMIDKIKSGKIKPPYRKKLREMGLNLYEINDIMEDIPKFDEMGRVIYHESPEGYWRKIGYDDMGNETYFEDHNGWSKREYDRSGNLINKESDDGSWMEWRYDKKGNIIFYQNSDGWWEKQEWDKNGNLIYKENSVDGIKFDHRG